MLVEVVGNVDSFNQRLQEYTGLLQQQQQEHAKLVERADKVVELVSQTYAQQKGAVHTLVRTSALLILVAAAAALLACSVRCVLAPPDPWPICARAMNWSSRWCTTLGTPSRP